MTTTLGVLDRLRAMPQGDNPVLSDRGTRFGTEDKAKHRYNTVIRPWREWSGRRTLPIGQELWSLCNTQDRWNPQSELHQFVSTKLLPSPHFYRGFDTDYWTILRNQRAWPESHWHNGLMSKAISDVDWPSDVAGIVYFDACGASGSLWKKNNRKEPGELHNLLLALEQADQHPFVVVNACTYTDRAKQHGAVNLRKAASANLTKQWKIEDFPFYEYPSGASTMTTCIMTRRD